MNVRVKSLLASLVLLCGSWTAVSGVAAAAPAEPSQECPNRMIFEMGGHGDPKGNAYNKGNEKLPEGVAATKVEYPAEIAPFPGNKLSLDESVKQGRQNLRKAIRDFHGRCSDAHITISGYSQGAIPAGDVLGELSETDEIPHSKINGVLYADSRRPASGNYPGGIQTNLPSIMPETTMRGPRGFGDLKVKSICNQNDGICYSDNLFTNALCFANGMAGYGSGAHGYDINPGAVPVDQGGDEVITQQPVIPPINGVSCNHGEIPGTTPYALLEKTGNSKFIQDKMAKFIKMLKKQFPEVFKALEDLPFGITIPDGSNEKKA